MSTKHFDQTLALKTLGSIMKEHGITHAELHAVFPERPTTEDQCTEVAAWLSRKITERKAGSTNPPAPLPQARPKFVTAEMLPEGNYAVPGKDGGKTRFYRVSHKEGKGKWAGTTFVNIKERASDDLYDMASKSAEAAAKWAILDYGYERSRLLFSEKYDACWHCFRGLTDEDNMYKVYGLGPVCGPKIMG